MPFGNGVLLAMDEHIDDFRRFSTAGGLAQFDRGEDQLEPLLSGHGGLDCGQLIARGPRPRRWLKPRLSDVQAPGRLRSGMRAASSTRTSIRS